MSISRPLLLALLALLTLLALFRGVLPLFAWRAEGNARLERALARQAEIRVLADEYEQLARRAASASEQKQTLFRLVNSEAERLQLARRIEAARPSTLREGGARGGPVESLDLRMNGLYLGQCVDWLHALEALPGLRIESLNLQRTVQNRLDLDCTLSRPGSLQAGAP